MKTIIKSYIVFFYSVFLLCAPVLGQETRTWTGGGVDNQATTTENWGSGLPQIGDNIVLNAGSHKNMTWNMTNLVIGSWLQDGYLGTVTVATVYGDAGFTNFNISGNCIINSGLWTHQANSLHETYRLKASIGGDFTIGAGGSVNVTGKGYGQSRGPGAALGHSDLNDRFRGGGSHGGRGGNGYDNIPGTGPCYGSITKPTNLGSGGGYIGGSGGGAVALEVSGKIINNGVIAADGQSTSHNTAAGGSVFLRTGSIEGSGVIRANGASGTGHGFGGGGRVSLVVTNAGADFSAYDLDKVNAFSGSTAAGNASYAGAGTVYLRSASQETGEGVLVIDNDNKNNTWYTDISSNVTDTTVGEVHVRHGARMLMLADQTIDVGNVWSNASIVEMEEQSSVIFRGGSGLISRIYGDTEFMGFVCTNGAGHVLEFEAGSVSSLPSGGRLRLSGTAGSELVLWSAQPGTRWKLNINPLTDQSVAYVNVQDSDAFAGDGAEVIALNSINSMNNLNWSFMNVDPGDLNVWTGNDSVIWDYRGNWSRNRAPFVSDTVLVPGSLQRYPELRGNISVDSLQVEAGGALALAGWDLTVKSNLIFSGTLTASGGETVRLLGDADFTGGSFNASRFKMVLAGGGTQVINPASLDFYKIDIVGGDVIFLEGFSTYEMVCEAPDSTRNIVFESGSLCEVGDVLVLHGSLFATNIILRSSSSGLPWSLIASGYRSVRGVDVRDCVAAGGLTIPAISSKDSSGNENWDFDPVWSIWVGETSSDFHAADNWIPAVIPDENSRVKIDSTNSVIINSAVTLLDLTVGGSSETEITANVPITVIENITVMDKGVLVLNQPCTVSKGFFVFPGGCISHLSNNDAENNKLDITVGGNLALKHNAVIDVTGKGYAIKKGPGAPVGSASSGGSYGGLGGRGNTDAMPCYGSIVSPTNLGSGGNGAAAGGAVLIKVAGLIRHYGSVIADGASVSTYYAGSGGTISFRSGELIGTGLIRAQGGSFGALTTREYAGGGGRVALVVTNNGADFARYSGSIKASGGYPLIHGVPYDVPRAAAGTVYLKTASEIKGSAGVVVDNADSRVTVATTDFPPAGHGYEPGEMDHVSFFLKNGARVRVQENYTVGDLIIENENVTLDLGGNILFVNNFPRKLEIGSIINYGEIRWRSGTMFRFW